MSITTLATLPTTLDELDPALTEARYLEHVHAEVAWEKHAEVMALVTRIGLKGKTLGHFTDPKWSPEVTDAEKRSINRAKRITWSNDNDVVANLSSLKVMTTGATWPVWKEGTPDEVIDGLAELLLMSDDAERIYHAKRESKRDRERLTVIDIDGDDLRNALGWYVIISTSRRQSKGWVTKASKSRVVVREDPLGAFSFDGATNVGTGFDLDDLAKAVVIYSGQKGEEVTYQMNTARIVWLLPPAMAAERHGWLDNVRLFATTVVDDAAAISLKWTAWAEKGTAAIKRRAKVKEFIEAMPASYSGGEEISQLRWVASGAEVFAVAVRELGEDRLRSLVVEQFRSKIGWTEDDQTVIDAEPQYGNESIAVIRANLLRARYGNVLAPTF